LKKENYGELASIMGRYYAMDRDKRWERIQCAYEGLVGGRGDKVGKDQVVEYIKTNRYGKKPKEETDEFLTPIIISDEGRIKDNDTLIFFDYRADRMREITETFGLQRHFQSNVPHPTGLHISSMTEYKKEFPFPVLFAPQSHKNVLAEWLASKNLSQVHCAETEKYAHVTFFFNGSREEAFPKEERIMVPSPKVATYDLQPEMSCMGVAQKMAEVIKTKQHPFVMCNFAPPDMVGHSGVYEATVIACEATDKAIGLVEEACKENDYVMLVTADHGNAEKMYDDKGGKHTAHTCNRVPFLSTGNRRFKPGFEINGRKSALCDVAPTVLDLMGLDVPKEMPGKSLLEP